MTNRYFYQSDITTFLSEDMNTIFGQMSRADEMDTASTQKFAWEQEITLMKQALASYSTEQDSETLIKLSHHQIYGNSIEISTDNGLLTLNYE